MPGLGIKPWVKAWPSQGACKSPEQQACLPFRGTFGRLLVAMFCGGGGSASRLSAGGVAVARPFSSPRFRRGGPPRGLGVRLSVWHGVPRLSVFSWVSCLRCAQLPERAVGKIRSCLGPHHGRLLDCHSAGVSRHDREGEGKGLGLGVHSAQAPGDQGFRSASWSQYYWSQGLAHLQSLA